MKPSVVLLLLLGVVAPRIAQAGDCVGSCIGIKDGDYRSCRGCEVYVTCSHGNLHDGRPCPGKLVWNDELKQCSTHSRTCTSGNPAGRRYKAPENPPNIPAQYGPDSNAPYGPPFLQHSPANTYSRSLERQAPYPADSFPPPLQAHSLPLPASQGFPRFPETAPQENPQPNILPGRLYSSHNQPPPGYEPLPAPPSKGSYKISNFPPRIPYPAIPYQSINEQPGPFLPNEYPDLPYPPVHGPPGPFPHNSPYPDLPYPPNNPEQKKYAPNVSQPDLPYPGPKQPIVGLPYSPSDKNSHPKDEPLQKPDPLGIKPGQEYPNEYADNTDPPGSGQKGPYPPKHKPSSPNNKYLGGPYPPINEPKQYPPGKAKLHQSYLPYPGESSKNHQAPYPPKSPGKGVPYPIAKKQPGQYPADQYPDQDNKGLQEPYPPSDEYLGIPYPLPNGKSDSYPSSVPGPSLLPPLNTGGPGPNILNKQYPAPPYPPPKGQSDTYPPSQGQPYLPSNKAPDSYPPKNAKSPNRQYLDEPYPPLTGQPGPVIPTGPDESYPPHTGLIAPYPPFPLPDQGYPNIQEPFGPSTFRRSKQHDNKPSLYPPSFSGRVPDSLGIGRPAVRSGVCIKDCTFIPNGDYQSCTGCHFYATCTGGYLYDNRPCPAYLCWDDINKRCERQSPTCDCRK